MAYTLKNLKITSTDLVDQGANPDAHVRLFKRSGENTQSLLEVQQQAEISQLKKRLVLQELETFAKKFEPLGKQSTKLADTFYQLKNTDQEIYQEFVALLDEQLTMTRQSTLFMELGHSTQGRSVTPTIEGLDQMATHRANEEDISSADAVVKIFEENPEFALEYEKQYRGVM